MPTGSAFFEQCLWLGARGFSSLALDQVEKSLHLADSTSPTPQPISYSTSTVRPGRGTSQTTGPVTEWLTHMTARSLATPRDYHTLPGPLLVH